MHDTCPICEHTDSQKVITRKGYTYLRCKNCSTAFVSPMPSKEEAKSVYLDSSYFFGQADVGYRNYEEMHKALRLLFQRRLQQLAKLIPQKGRLLDVGCADGYFLELARAQGWEIAGVEVSPEMSSYASQHLGIRVYDSIDELAYQKWDVVTLWEVVEHLPNPIDELRRLGDLLRPGGLLLLSTPNAGHWQALQRPSEWLEYRAPAHLVLFTPTSLFHALERAGFKQIQIQKSGVSPKFPNWLQVLTRELRQKVTDATASPWLPALAAWRAVRLLGLIYHKVTHPGEDIFVTLEAIACRAD